MQRGTAGKRRSASAAEQGQTPLGVTYLPQGSTFSVYAEADGVRVRLVHPGSKALSMWEMHPVEGEPGVWSIALEGDWRGWSYSFEIDRAGRTIADILDPWAKLVRDHRGYVAADETRVSPRPKLEPQDAIIYELHVRDFTRDPACGVRPDWRGKYLGLAQAGTKLEGTSLPTCLDHICELGVNVVQLMPVHSFAMPYNPEYEWGYMPNDFNAPHAGYAASVELEAPIREFKRLVSALHERGLRVTLDVVYNHTAERWPSRVRSFMALAPETYFRFKDALTPWNGSACGNEFRSDSAMGRRFIIESAKYWVSEFGIDGFRFDLMGLIDQETMTILTRELHAMDPSLLIYGEPWAAGPTPIEVNGKGKQRGRGWGAFNDDIRDGLRGEVFKPKEPGFLAAGQNAARVKIGVRGGIGAWTDDTCECINYIECHDNHTLSDRLALTTPPESGVTTQQRTDMNLMGALALLTSQGIPFLHSGQEFGRSKNGEDNTYNLGDQINNIDWSDKAERHRVFAFYRDMIKIRRSHPMFRLRAAGDVTRAVKMLDDDLKLALPAGTMGWHVTDVTGKDAWSEAVVVLNGSKAEAHMPLPGGVWTRAAIDGIVAEAGPFEKVFTLPAHQGALLFIKR